MGGGGRLCLRARLPGLLQVDTIVDNRKLENDTAVHKENKPWVIKGIFAGIDNYVALLTVGVPATDLLYRVRIGPEVCRRVPEGIPVAVK